MTYKSAQDEPAGNAVGTQRDGRRGQRETPSAYLLQSPLPLSQEGEKSGRVEHSMPPSPPLCEKKKSREREEIGPRAHPCRRLSAHSSFLRAASPRAACGGNAYRGRKEDGGASTQGRPRSAERSSGARAACQCTGCLLFLPFSARPATIEDHIRQLASRRTEQRKRPWNYFRYKGCGRRRVARSLPLLDFLT